MSLAKTECHCPRCGKLKRKRDGSPHKCVPPVAVPFTDNTGNVIAFDPKMTIGELTKRGVRFEIVPDEETPLLPDGVFRSLPNGPESGPTQ